MTMDAPIEEGTMRSEQDAVWSEDVADTGGLSLVTSDLATCPACVRELFDPADRRYLYPFISCADCGPRFSIVESLPFGRERTTMRMFPMCAACAEEHEDPTNRRFHAELVACARCGPHLTLLGPSGWGPHPGDPIEEVAAMVKSGSIVAVKDLGGFHLVCDATNEASVSRLRHWHGRSNHPLPVMVSGFEDAGSLADVTDEEAEALSSRGGPIVLVWDSARLANSATPEDRFLGLMLPSTPLQHLLIHAVGGPLVVASGNRSNEPICLTDAEARDRLSKLAEAFLVHDLEFLGGIDDSIAIVRAGGPALIRRGRGFAPVEVPLSEEVRPILGAGGAGGASFCLARGTRAYLSENLGDLDMTPAMGAYARAVERYTRLFQFEPEIVAHDLDPELATTRFAQGLGLPTFGVQQHHARVAAVMAAYGLDGRVIGVAFDEGGQGDDGTTWGGEFLLCDWATAERAGHLRPVVQPGTNAAVRNPVGMALSHAVDAGVLKEALRLLGTDRSHAKPALAHIESRPNQAVTSSAMRLIDGVSALAGLRREATYPWTPAILLEEVADPSATFEYPFDLEVDGGRVVLDTRPLIGALVKDLSKGRGAGEVTGRFHRTMAAAILSVCRLLRGRSGLTRVCLAGSVFQDDLLTSDLSARLAACDFEVFIPTEPSLGDGDMALGQILVAHGRVGRPERGARTAEGPIGAAVANVGGAGGRLHLRPLNR